MNIMRASAWACGAASLVLEARAILHLLGDRAAVGIALHLAAAAMFGASLYLAHGRGASASYWGIFGGCGALLMPGYGMGLLLTLLLALRFIPPPVGDLLAEFVEHTAPGAEVGGGSHRMRAGDLPMVEHLSVEPLIDMLDTPDIDRKRAVIDAMAKRRGKKLIAAIQTCLTDPRPEIYQYAMARLGKLQEDYTRDIGTATREVETAPHEPAPRYRLAALYETYLGSGLVDSTLVDFYRGLLMKEYRAILAMAPDDTAAALALGRLLVDVGQIEEAAGHLEAVLARDPGNVEARFGMVGVHYARRDWYSMQIEVEEVLTLGATREQSQSEILELAQWLRGDTNEAELPSRATALQAAPVLAVPATRISLPALAPAAATPAAGGSRTRLPAGPGQPNPLTFPLRKRLDAIASRTPSPPGDTSSGRGTGPRGA